MWGAKEALNGVYSTLSAVKIIVFLLLCKQIEVFVKLMLGYADGRGSLLTENELANSLTCKLQSALVNSQTQNLKFSDTLFFLCKYFAPIFNIVSACLIHKPAIDVYLFDSHWCL